MSHDYFATNAILINVAVVFTSLSIVGSLLMIYLSIKENQTITRGRPKILFKKLMCLAIGDLLLAISTILFKIVLYLQVVDSFSANLDLSLVLWLPSFILWIYFSIISHIWEEISPRCINTRCFVVFKYLLLVLIIIATCFNLFAEISMQVDEDIWYTAPLWLLVMEMEIPYLIPMFVYIVVFASSIIFLIIIWKKNKSVWYANSNKNIFRKFILFVTVNAFVWAPHFVLMSLVPFRVLLEFPPQLGLFFLPASVSGLANSIIWICCFRELGHHLLRTPLFIKRNQTTLLDSKFQNDTHDIGTNTSYNRTCLYTVSNSLSEGNDNCNIFD